MRFDVLIIEDELPARRKLKRYIDQLEADVQVAAECATVEEAILFFEKGGQADLIFSDISLQDGNAFEIYQEIALKSPIIFTTAYDNHMLKAFESNGIDYLLKPFTFERFEKAWKKFLLFTQQHAFPQKSTAKPESFEGYKSRFIINTTKDSYFLEVENIAYFLSEGGVVKAIDQHGKGHILNTPTLKEIEDSVDPGQFFRINRGELVHKPAIERMERYGKNNLAIKVRGIDKPLITSQSATATFREWVEK